MAGTIMRSTQFRSIVEPILNQEFNGIYDQRKDEYKEVFSVADGIKRAYHEEPVLYGLGAAPMLPDGMPVTYDEGGELYVKRYTYDIYGLAFALTRTLVEDGDHIRVGSTYSRHLAQSMTETEETVHANILQAEVLLKSVLRAGTSNNDINPVKSTGMMEKATTISRMTSPTAWFIQTDAKDGMKSLWRRRVEKSMEGDFETDSMRYKSTMRFAAGWTDWRAMYGNAGV